MAAENRQTGTCASQSSEAYCGETICKGGCNAHCNTACQSCDSTGGCQTIQNFCKTSQSAASYISLSCLFNQACIASNEIIGPDVGLFNRDAWNSIFEKLQSIYSYGALGGHTISSQKETSSFITASNVKALASEVGSASAGSIAKEGVIYGTYFSDIASAVRSLSIDKNQCDNCNISCNVTCNNNGSGSCQTCDSSGCQTGNNYCNYTCKQCSGSCSSQRCCATT